MTREEKINQFLNLFKSLLEQHPDYELTSKTIYHYLIFSGVNSSDKSIDLSDKGSSKYNEDSVFTNWRHSFQDNPNIDVFRTPDHMYFCQFVSSNYDVTMNKNHIKVYIPLDGEHIEDGAKMIFEYIAANDMPHASKIGKRIRFDDIVIRLTEPSDALKLINFVKHNKYLQEGLIEPSPFAVQKDNIAVVCDGKESYNTILSKLITKYLLTCRNENSLNLVSYQDFFNFVAYLYDTAFIKHNLNDLQTIFDLSSKNKVENIEQIINLILLSQESTFDFDNFIKYYRKCSDYKENANELLLSAVEIMTNKFGDYGAAIRNIEGYIYTGRKSLITRDQNLRDRLEISNFRSALLEKLQDIDLATYIAYINNQTIRFEPRRYH
ncbi:MAG: hypothetical protein IJI58_00705 [Bacilli bacterium]|nr:hypothetical protein [Bacilli bacterium]